MDFRYKYQDLAKLFWIKSRTYVLTPSQGFLYFYLLDKCDSGRWENPFILGASQIIGETGLSDDTVNTSKRRLEEAKLIKFSTKKGGRYSVFQLLNIPIKSEAYPEGLENMQKKMPKKSAGLCQEPGKPPTNLPQNIPIKSEALSISPIYNKQIQTQIHKDVCVYFGLDEINHSRNWKLALAFAEGMVRLQKAEHFSEKFSSYTEYKELTNEIRHGFQTFIGKPENNYEDGAWNSQNWTKKLQDKKRNGNVKQVGLSKIFDITKLINRQSAND